MEHNFELVGGPYDGEHWIGVKDTPAVAGDLLMSLRNAATQRHEGAYLVEPGGIARWQPCA